MRTEVVICPIEFLGVALEHGVAESGVVDLWLDDSGNDRGDTGDREEDV